MQAGQMPVVLNESDVYREFAPPAWARRAVACFWLRRGDGSSVRVLPDACSDIVWRSGAGAVVAGPDSEAWVSRTRPGELIVGARLRPGAGGAALGVGLDELRNTRVPIDALGVDPRGELRGELDPDAAAAALVAIALRRVAQAPPDPAVQAAVVRLLAPGQRVDELASALGFSERQLRRRFLAAVGYGPKTLQRVMRLRRFLAAARFDAGFDGLAAAAAGAGYADQAHLARECRALTGLTPGQLVTPGPRP
ncbi:MAG TPA: helix-turn-helix domain-containing protein [Solirubrobacteraceae bacterium]|nr:helix-turn-helix domain-containing protein [Solirubrobacteraceae bacterium]